jgi:hypothetical protein
MTGEIGLQMVTICCIVLASASTGRELDKYLRRHRQAHRVGKQTGGAIDDICQYKNYEKQWRSFARVWTSTMQRSVRGFTDTIRKMMELGNWW